MGRFNYSGLVIAVIGFVLTRFTVSLALYDDPVRFYVAGIIPLVLGLGLAAFGVALVVADLEQSLVRITATWCVIGAGTMLVLVLLTVVGSTGTLMPPTETLRSQLYFSNFLIGGAIGGTLTGLYAARSRRHHAAVRQQANRLEVLNRILRHEVLNAITIIKGYADLDPSDHPNARRVITEHADAISRTIDNVRYLSESTTTSTTPNTPLDLKACLQASIQSISEEYPDAEIETGTPDHDVEVMATSRLELAFTHLLENAIIHTQGDTPHVQVTVHPTPSRVEVSITDHGPGLPQPQQDLLDAGEITEFDDPRDGYGLNVVRLLVESFGGTIDTTVTGEGTTITVSLRRPPDQASGVQATDTGLTGLRLDYRRLLIVLGASIVAAIAYGAVSHYLGGDVAGIGVFYGLPDPAVGWITHQFHSAVFAFMYAGLLTQLPARYRDHLPAYIGLALAWGLALWIGASGFIAPIWLTLLDIPVPIPNLTSRFLFTHIAWGLALGTLTGLGYRHLTPADT